MFSNAFIMKTKVQFWFILVFCSTVLAQQKTIDSLQNALKSAKNDIDKVKTLNNIADFYKTQDIKLLDSYAKQALVLAKKIDFKNEEANANLLLGNKAIIEGDYKTALNYFATSQAILENENQANTDVKKYLAKTYGSIGIVFSEQSNYMKALRYYLKSVAIFEKLKDEEKCAKLYNNIGVVYQAQKNYFKALEYFTKAQKIQEKIHDAHLGVTYTNIGNCYFNQNNYNQAFQYYQKAEKIIIANKNPRAEGELYNNLGLYYEANNQNNKAETSWQQAIAQFQSIGDKFGIADTYLYLGNYYYKQNQFAIAIENGNKTVALAKEIGVLEQQVLAQKLLSNCYEKQGNATLALQYLQKYNVLKDSLHNEENVRKSVETEMNFDFEKKAVLQKEELQKKELLIQESAKRNKMQLIFALLVGLLLSGIVFLIYNRIQLKNRLTLQKELAEYEQKALHLQMNPHFVFNCLASISSFIVNNGKESAVRYLSKFAKLMRFTLESSKESLISIDKEIEGLQLYLDLEKLRFNNKFDFEITKDKEVEDAVGLPPLLIQPFVENAVIHGVIPKKEMGKIAIHFYIENDQLICEIQDNGLGVLQSQKMKENLVKTHNSMATDIIKKRLQMIASSTGKPADIEINELTENNVVLGTEVIVKIPLQYMDEK